MRGASLAEAAPDGRCQKDRDNQWTVRMRLLLLLLQRLLLQRLLLLLRLLWLLRL